MYINRECVLGYRQEQIIRLFQSIPAGKLVNIQICRGYPLLFDNSVDDGVEKKNVDEVETIVVDLTKGDIGFGFTITDCPYGQQVNAVIDRERCRGLLSGDILVEINGRNVRRCGHTEIVELLRQCRINETVQIVCNRYKSESDKRGNF